MYSADSGLVDQTMISREQIQSVYRQLKELGGTPCFEELLDLLIKRYQAELGFIAQLDCKKQTAQTVAAKGAGREFNEFGFSLIGSPFQDLANSTAVYDSANLARRFPADQLLKQTQAQSILYSVLHTAKGEPVGLVCLYFKEELENPERIKCLFQIYCLRCAIEMQNFVQSQQFNGKIRQLEKKNKQLEVARQVYNFTCDGIIVCDADNNIIFVNRALERMSGYSEEELIQQNPRILNSGIQQPDFYQQLWHNLLTKGFWEGELWNRHKNGTTYPVQTSLISVKGSDGKVVNHIAIQRDISDEKQAQEIISYQATHDALTGLLNRYEFNGQLQHLLAHNKRHNEVSAFLLLDLDDFKSVNDSLGHAEGDFLLTQVSDRLKRRLRNDDILARLGGDEFAIFACFDEESGIDVLAEKILDIFNEPFQLENGGSLLVSTSVGISVYPRDAATSKELFSCADQAMYRAKSEGRSSYAFFTKELRVKALRHQLVRQRLSLAVETNSIRVDFQPIISVKTGEVCHCEALARWQDAELGVVSPNEFIRVAENTGLIRKLGEQLSEKAIAQISELNAQLSRPLSVAINRSPQEFVSFKAENDYIHQQLRRYDFPAHLLCIELTESLMVKNPAMAKFHLNGLKNSGVRLAMDDFGTGYSSLGYLKHFPFDYLKIDQGFVKDIEAKQDNYQLVKTIIEMAKNFNMQTIAEGVETQEQLGLLRQLGCDYAQGFLISPAITALEIKNLIESRPIY